MNSNENFSKPWLAVCLMVAMVGTAATAQVADYQRLNWRTMWNPEIGDWNPAGACQGDCEGILYGNKYCSEGLECRLATVDDDDQCSGLAVVGVYYCFPTDENVVLEAQEDEDEDDEESEPIDAEEEENDAEEEEEEEEDAKEGKDDKEKEKDDKGVEEDDKDDEESEPMEEPQEAQEVSNVTKVSFTYQEWTFNEETDEWELPTCGAGCDGEDRWCSGDNVCVWGGDDEDNLFVNRACEGVAEGEGWYFCVPPTTETTVDDEGDAPVQAQEAKVATFTYNEWTRNSDEESEDEWQLPTCGGGCDGEERWCSGDDVCVWGEDIADGVCEGEKEDGWYFCVPPS